LRYNETRVRASEPGVYRKKGVMGASAGRHGGVTATVVDGPAVEELIRLFEVLSAEEGWKPDGQLRAYPANSVYFATYVGDELAGGIHLVVANGCDPMPASHVWPEVDLSCRTDAAHALIMAIRKEFRGCPGLFAALTVEMWRFCATRGVLEIWHEATPPTLRLYRRMGWPLEVEGGLRPHWGEPCFLCRMTVAEVAGQAVIRAIRSDARRDMVAAMVRPLEHSGASVAGIASA